MAVSPAARRRTQRYFRDQRGVAQRAFLAFRAFAWPLLNPEDVTGSWQTFQQASVNIVSEQYATSARLAARYYDEFRVLEEVPDLFIPEPATMTAGELATTITALQAEGREGLRHRQSLRLPDAVSVTQRAVAGVVTEQSLYGGRRTIMQSVRNDRRSLGWARVTSGRPCAFCALLASRGPVYTETSVRFRAHGSCICGAEPVFSRATEWPGRSREFRDLYDSVARGEPDPINAFRRAYEGRAA